MGDTTVPKRMKTMAEAFGGRSAAYDAALRGGRDALTGALARNVYGGRRDAAALTAYVEAATAALAMTPLQAFVDGGPRFPEAATFAEEPT